ncbi:MAG: ribose-phosphate pyrophosphokinase [Chloroflexi bacterium]|nr:ribose-phosphate pyrophosphokinase [Chloroflexota bacterium]MYC54628.1 ribose-phosphate pyrophosphokinase [Chloroflexota bacterium]MYD37296.1 ribose-phosphate pyrophosphokinase [Chloroflexota bacterium]
MRFGSMKIFSGSASQELGSEISDYIRGISSYNVKPGAYYRTVFSNENIFIKLEESVRGKDVYLVQTMASPVHDNFMEMLIMIDALKRDSAWRINLVVPYMSYTRSDKKDQPRVPISARLIANMIETAGVDRYMTIDLHSGQIQGFFNIPGDALTAFHLLSDYILARLRAGELGDLVVVATDLGFAKQGRNWAETLGVPLAFVEKRRVSNAESPRALSLIGSVEGKNVLLVDDEVNTAGSVVNAVNVVRDYGARDVLFAFTHPFFSERAYERLAALGLREIIFTNTLAIPEARKLPNMTVLSIAPLLGEVILRAHEGRSVGALFNE